MFIQIDTITEWLGFDSRHRFIQLKGNENAVPLALILHILYTPFNVFSLVFDCYFIYLTSYLQSKL